MSRRTFLAAVGGLGATVVLGSEAWGAPTRAPANGLDTLDVLSGDYPRAWYFRQTENTQIYTCYHDWEVHFRHLNGIEGKAFQEEYAFDETLRRKYFTKFKQQHPEKLVLLHFNGKGRRLAFNGDLFFPGHWLYYAGTTITTAANATATTLQVADPSVVSMERDATVLPCMPDELVIVPPGSDGPDWAGAEFVQLTGIDNDTNTLTVQRGQHGTTPIAIPAGSYLAAVVRQRPQGLQPPESLWVYNYSINGLRDPDGRRCIDVLADELAGYLAPGGVAAAYDGVEFDAFFFIPHSRDVPRQKFVVDEELVDIDNDGIADAVADVAPGFVDGTNVYGLGVTELCGLLRSQLPDKLIMADGMNPLIDQRSFGILNGIEAEGWPELRDPDIADWSGGLNRFEFWKRRGAAPVLNYAVFKYTPDLNKPGIDPTAYQKLRLVLAGAQFTDAAFALLEKWGPPPVDWNGVDVLVFDELCLGQEQHTNWLGQPIGDAQHLAASTPNMLTGTITVHPLHGQTTDTGAPLRLIDLGRVEISGADLFVALSAQGNAIDGYPATIARRLALRVYADGATEPAGEIYSWFDNSPMTSTFAFRGLTPGEFRLELQVEGGRAVSIPQLTAHDHPDATYRLFDHGLVLANPSKQPFTFNLDEIAPGRSYHRILGVADQDPGTNSGEPVGSEVTVGAIDGLFLVQDDH